MRLISMAAVTLGVFAVGCGGGSGSKSPSGGSAPNLATTVASSTPANNAKAVAIDQPITIRFAQAIDPNSLSDTTVQVIPVMTMTRMGMRMGMAGEDVVEQVMDRLAGTRTFSASAQQLTFTPAEHLENGMTYRVILSGLRAQGGAALSTAMINFATLVNPMTKRVTYTNGVVDRIHIYDIDPATGMHTEMRTYQGTESPATLQSRTVMMNATIPGPPQVAVSEVSFDVLTNNVKSYDAPIKEGTTIVAFGDYVAPGQDGFWNQGDDLLESYFEMAEQHGTHFVMQRFAAANQTPAPWSARGTAAFTARGVELTERDAMGRSLRQIVYSSLGANGVIDFDSVTNAPKPVDDVVTQYTVIERNAAGQRIKSFRFGKRAGRGPNPTAPIAPAGPNGVLFDADDPITEYEFTDRDATGHETLEIEYKEAGPGTGPGGTVTRADWEASTSDNVVDSYEVTTYVNGVRVSEKEYDAVDGIKDNGNDLLTEETTFNPAL